LAAVLLQLLADLATALTLGRLRNVSLISFSSLSVYALLMWHRMAEVQKLIANFSRHNELDV
jgi:hypothetical protein